MNNAKRRRLRRETLRATRLCSFTRTISDGVHASTHRCGRVVGHELAGVPHLISGQEFAAAAIKRIRRQMAGVGA